MEKPEVKLIPLGVGNSFSAIHYYAHMLLIINERRIQMDMGGDQDGDPLEINPQAFDGFE